MSSLELRLFSREVVPCHLSLLARAPAALVVDTVLHLLHAVCIGRWLGIPRTLLILFSPVYSLPKRKLTRSATFLRLSTVRNALGAQAAVPSEDAVGTESR